MNILFYVITLELFVVSIIDFKTKKISNYWTLVNFILSIIFYVMGTFPFEFQALIIPVATIIVGFFLFLAHIMGAGDSKYLASLFLLLPWALQLKFFENVLLSTILVGGILLITKVIMSFNKLKGYALSLYFKGILQEIRSRFSYAPVLLLAWLLLGKELW